MATLQEQLQELRAEESRLLNTPVSKRSKELLSNIRSLIAAIENEDIHTDSCECGYCEKNEAAFAAQSKVEPDDEDIQDSAIESVYNKFSNTISMNKKVIAGLLIVTAVVITVVAVKMYKKASKTAE